MIYLLMTAEIVCGSVTHLTLAEGEQRGMNRLRLLWWNYLTALLISIGMLVFQGKPDGTFQFSALLGTEASADRSLTGAIATGAVTGLLFLANYITMQHSIAQSGAGTTSVITRLGSMIISLAVSVLFHETLSGANLAGIVLACAAIFLIYSGGLRMSWVLPVLFLISGGQHLIKKVYLFYDGGSCQTMYYIAIYLTAIAACSLVIGLRGERPAFRAGELLFGCIIGIISIFNTYVLLYLLRQLPVAIVTPIISGGGILLTSAISAKRYHETMSLKKVMGLAATVISIVLMI